jgi:hypothetical protein
MMSQWFARGSGTPPAVAITPIRARVAYVVDAGPDGMSTDAGQLSRSDRPMSFTCVRPRDLRPSIVTVGSAR